MDKENLRAEEKVESEQESEHDAYDYPPVAAFDHYKKNGGRYISKSPNKYSREDEAYTITQ